MKLKKIGVIAAMMGVAFAGNAMADGFYVGGGVGMYKAGADLEGNGAKISFGGKNEAVANAFVGYEVSSGALSLAAELGYNSGYGKVAAYNDGAGNNLEGNMKNAGAMYSLLPAFKATDNMKIFARFGMTKIKTEAAGNVLTGSSDADASVFGLGIEYGLSKQLSLRTEYQMIQGKSKEITGTTADYKASSSGVVASLKYRF